MTQTYAFHSITQYRPHNLHRESECPKFMLYPRAGSDGCYCFVLYSIMMMHVSPQFSHKVTHSMLERSVHPRGLLFRGLVRLIMIKLLKNSVVTGVQRQKGKHG